MSGMLFSQVAIGKNAVSSDAVSLDFGNENRGLLLPWVDNTAAVNAVDGTMIYDTSDHKVKVKYAAGWVDLSVDNTGAADTTIQDGKSDLADAKVSIGTPTASPDGILVLEDDNKAMVLPKVSSVNDIVSPSPGMMVFVTSGNLLAVFNGTVWTFWQAVD